MRKPNQTKTAQQYNQYVATIRCLLAQVEESLDHHVDTTTPNGRRAQRGDNATLRHVQDVMACEKALRELAYDLNKNALDRNA